ncbi:hypothetical protein BWK59_15070 [Flavobacterium davisii]|uniref:MORN repeat variant n=1 Tax=Flavobacterium davisii TaxID=2906077 RepID=A0A246GES8_9FLAO|nr:hypothetical protein [Flavobacterium davisii]OWP82593.1 hypothetical protein BWK59_15070 [Flavobacterium davisii]
MKKHFFLCLLFTLISCKDSKVIEKIDSTTKNRETYNYIVLDNDTLYHGNAYTYNSKDKVIEKCVFNKGLVNGVLYRYYDNGKLKEYQYLKNGFNFGKAVSYFENGKIETSLNYRQDTLIGDAYDNYPNGNLKKYLLYDSLGRIPIVIHFNKNKRIKIKEGRAINCFLNTDKIKFGSKLNLDCLIPNIPNTQRNIKFIYSNGKEGKRRVVKKDNNYLSVEESNYVLGENVLYVIAEYKFNKEYHNQIIKDTAFIDFYVN